MGAQRDFGNINLDRSQNIVPLCPICHSAVHHGSHDEKRSRLKQIYDDRYHELYESGVIISFDDLIHKYYK